MLQTLEGIIGNPHGLTLTFVVWIIFPGFPLKYDTHFGDL